MHIQRFPTPNVPITCHAWNKDRTECALSPNNNIVCIYKRQGDNWSLTDELTQHELRVTSLDWAQNSNRIVTCSEDRNAYVWTKVDGLWKPTLVILRINRAATCVRWSPSENKFAAGSGARRISVCYFDEPNDWWLSKHLKKDIRSTITCLDWHPNDVLIACGSTDFTTKIFSSYIKEIEKKPSPTPWGMKMPFGHVMAEYKNAGWAHSVSFSVDGSKLAWVCHDSTITVVDTANLKGPVKLYTRFLPFLTCVWISDTNIICAGYDCCPMVFSYEDGNIQFVRKAGKQQKKEADGFSAMRKFRDMDKRAIVENNTTDTVLDTIHQNTITSLSIYAGTKSTATVCSTAGIDGQMVLWKLDALDESFDNLHIS